MQPVPGGFIQLLDSASFRVSATFGDDEGRFTLTTPGLGEYRIQVEAFSYHSMDDGPITVGAMFPAFPVHPNDIAAVEVYATRGETPAQYRDARARCGTILIWTRWKNSPAL